MSIIKKTDEICPDVQRPNQCSLFLETGKKQKQVTMIFFI